MSAIGVKRKTYAHGEIPGFLTRSHSAPSGRSVSALQEKPDFSWCGNWCSVAARKGYCIHDPQVSRPTVRRYSPNENRLLRGLGGATASGRLACTTSLFVAARSLMAPARRHLAATLPLRTAGSP